MPEALASSCEGLLMIRCSLIFRRCQFWDPWKSVTSKAFACLCSSMVATATPQPPNIMICFDRAQVALWYVKKKLPLSSHWPIRGRVCIGFILIVPGWRCLGYVVRICLLWPNAAVNGTVFDDLRQNYS